MSDIIKNGFKARVEDREYFLEVNTNGMNLAQLSLLLVCLHIIEKKILDHINEIPSNYESDFEIDEE